MSKHKLGVKYTGDHIKLPEATEYDWADDSKKCYDLWIAINRTKYVSRCPFCGSTPFREEQQHGHYFCVSCKTVTAGCCDGNTG